ncbi:MAG TPA: M13 family metallopeptidase N-terminal domain-containing protein, partial [Gammaproteobacteria bacterium]|nr:M13 family metallopeptidase N-terminal domain-containing protein [Gammaproteobacteria bacterium]
MRLHRPVIELLALSTAALAAAPPISAATHGIDVAGMDSAIAPGNDFYGYANGGWLKSTTIPADQATWGNFQQLREQTLERTRGLLEEAEKSQSAAGTDERKVADYYASFLDAAAIEKQGLAPLKAELDSIAAIKNLSDVARFFGASQRIDVDPLNNT